MEIGKHVESELPFLERQLLNIYQHTTEILRQYKMKVNLTGSLPSRGFLSVEEEIRNGPKQKSNTVERVS